MLSLVGLGGSFEVNVSVPLVLEYEEVAKRQLRTLRLSSDEVDDIIDYICSVANRRRIFFLWRPYLRDPRDDMVLELAQRDSRRKFEDALDWIMVTKPDQQDEL